MQGVQKGTSAGGERHKVAAASKAPLEKHFSIWFFLFGLTIFSCSVTFFNYKDHAPKIHMRVYLTF